MIMYLCLGIIHYRNDHVPVSGIIYYRNYHVSVSWYIFYRNEFYSPVPVSWYVKREVPDYVEDGVPASAITHQGPVGKCFLDDYSLYHVQEESLYHILTT